MSHRVCPWWLGYLLASPLRRLLQDPATILRPHVRQGMSVMDVGCGMGFFSLPMAELVGGSGRVVSVDLQEKMIRGLLKRAEKAGLKGRIEARVCTSASLGVSELSGTMDFALLFALAHEVTDRKRLFDEVHFAMKSGGEILLAEPTGHVSEAEFTKTLAAAQEAGFRYLRDLAIRRSRSVLMEAGPRPK